MSELRSCIVFLSVPGKDPEPRSFGFPAGSCPGKGTEQMVGAGTGEEPHRESSGQEGKGTEGICRSQKKVGVYFRSDPDREKTAWGGDKADLAEIGVILAGGITAGVPGEEGFGIGAAMGPCGLCHRGWDRTQGLGMKEPKLSPPKGIWESQGEGRTQGIARRLSPAGNFIRRDKIPLLNPLSAPEVPFRADKPRGCS